MKKKKNEIEYVFKRIKLSDMAKERTLECEILEITIFKSTQIERTIP